MGLGVFYFVKNHVHETTFVLTPILLRERMGESRAMTPFMCSQNVFHREQGITSVSKKKKN